MRSNWSLFSGSIFRMSFLAVAVLIGCGTRSFAVPPADFTVESPAQGMKFQLSKAKGKVVAHGSPQELRAQTGTDNLEDAFVRAIGSEEGLFA